MWGSATMAYLLGTYFINKLLIKKSIYCDKNIYVLSLQTGDNPKIWPKKLCKLTKFDHKGVKRA
jgi:hypothetical protein